MANGLSQRRPWIGSVFARLVLCVATWLACLSLTDIACAANVNIISNGTFVSGSVNAWTNWAYSVTGSRGGFSTYANPGPNSDDDNVGSEDLIQSGLLGLNNGPGALGAGQIVIQTGWNTCGTNNAILKVYIGATLYGSFTTPNSASFGANTAVTSYSNGASGSAGSIVPASNWQNWTYYPWTINLPTSVTASSSLHLSFVINGAGCAADISVKSVSLNIYTPTLTLTKISNGGTGAFTFTGTNGWSNQTITTATVGTGVVGTTQVLTNTSTATTITEAIPSGYALTAATCTGLGSGGTATPNLPAGSIALNAAATATGSAIACTFTNGKIPTIALQKVMGGTGRLYAADQFTLTASGSGAPASITTTGSGTSITSSGISFNATSGSAYSLSEAMAAGSTSVIADYIQSAACINAYGGGTSVSGLTTVPINFNAVYGDVISCIITNAPGTPNLTITKTYAPTSTFSVGQNVTYTYVISNTGNVPLHNVQVKDMHGSPATLVALGAGGISGETLSTPGPLGSGASPDTTANNGIWSTLAPGAAVTFTWAHTVTQTEIDHG